MYAFDIGVVYVKFVFNKDMSALDNGVRLTQHGSSTAAVRPPAYRGDTSCFCFVAYAYVKNLLLHSVLQ